MKKIISRILLAVGAFMMFCASDTKEGFTMAFIGAALLILMWKPAEMKSGLEDEDGQYYDAP